MCTCPAIPVAHNSGWCEMTPRPVSEREWVEFELRTLEFWAERH